ncbi:MAG: response regulator transcription factor [Saprospiraceae bacterium]|nr:response regulator transcription factor [Saprospiraceae bacterium]
MKCLAVDDELLALDLLADNIQKVPFLHLVGRCRNAFETLQKIESERPDLVFIDIQMPGLTGVELVRSLQTIKPMVVFVTAYEDYALEGYALNVLDYLVKPVPFERFFIACQKAKEIYDLKNSAVETPQTSPFFFVNADYSLIKIVVEDILYIEGMKDYLKIHLSTLTKPIITRMSFKSIEEHLPEQQFFRVHKSYLVNIAKIQSIRSGFVFINNHKVPLSEIHREAFLKTLKLG